MDKLFILLFWHINSLFCLAEVIYLDESIFVHRWQEASFCGATTQCNRDTEGFGTSGGNEGVSRFDIMNIHRLLSEFFEQVDKWKMYHQLHY